MAEARSAEEALVVARGFRPERAVLDLRMADRSRPRAARSSSRREHPELACIVLTGYGSIATALEAVRRGALDYLTKPADADEVLRAFARREPGRADADGGRAEPTQCRRCTASSGSTSSASSARLRRQRLAGRARCSALHRRTLQRKLATRPPSR